MRIYIFLLIMLVITNQLIALQIDKKDVNPHMYSVKIGVFKQKSNIQKILKHYPKEKIAVVAQKNKHHVYITNIPTKIAAKKIQSRIRRKFPNAYIISNKPKHRRHKQTIKKVVPPEQNVTIHTVKVSTPIATTKNSENSNPTVVKHSNKIATTNRLYHNQTILLKDALMIALSKSNKILSLREKVIQQKRKIDEKTGAYKPNITLYATGGYNYTHTRADAKSEDKYSTADGQISVTENLYAGGKHTHELKKEQTILASESASFRSNVEEESLKIIESYLNMYYQKRAIEIETKNMKNLQKILDIVQIKEANGAATKGDLNNIKSKVENASTALVKTSSAYQNARSFFEYFVGKENSNKEPIEGNFTFSNYQKNDIFTIFEQNNAKLLITKYKIQAQKYDYNAKKSPFRPTVDLIITGKEKFSKAVVDPYRDEKASAVLSLNYNLYKGGQDEAKLRSSKSKIAQLQYKYIDMLDSTKYNLKQLYENIKSLDDTLIHTANEVQANQKVVDAYWDAFKYGNQDLQALLLAQRALNRSQQDKLKEQQNYILGHFKLLSEMGLLLKYLKIEDFVNPDKIIQR